MKLSQPKIAALVAAAIVSLGQGSKADESGEIILIENLPIKDRVALEEQIRILDQHTRVDWTRVVPGVNHKGELVLLPRDLVELERVEEPSCWSK